MFLNYFKIAYRNLLKHKGYSAINVIGLTLGLIVSLVIAFYVIDDLTFDRFHEDSDRIYRVLTFETTHSGSMIYSITAGPLIPASVSNIPEVESGVRVFGMGRPLVAAGNVPPQELTASNAVQLRGLITEPEFFDVFSFKILSGDTENALRTPNGILITPESAELLFPGEDPVGKRLTIQFMGPGSDNQQDPFVIGLVEKPPLNSHIQYDFIIPLQIQNNAIWWDSWENYMLQGYIKLKDPAQVQAAEEKMNNLARANNMTDINVPKLQSLHDVHLGSSEHRYDGSNRGKNDATVVYALAVIGILVLFVAGINFVNLSSARASQRAREVGLRKVVGSNKILLISQFLGESILLTTAAMLIAVIVVQVTLPYLGNFLGKVLEIDFISNPSLLLIMFLVSFIVGIAAGIYPALILSSFRPVTVLRGEFRKGRVGVLIRRVLVVCQFSVTIALIIGVLVIMEQIKFLQSMDMGYNREQVITMFAPNNARELFKERIKNLRGVTEVGRSNGVLGSNFMRIEVIPEGNNRDQAEMFMQMSIDDKYLDVLEIEMDKGRSFAGGFVTDTTESLLLNETAAKKLGWQEPVGKRLDLIGVDGTIQSRRVVGVVKDFHFSDARQKLEPLMFELNTQNTFLTLARLAPGQIDETIEEIRSVYAELFPDVNFNFQFLDETFDRQFQNDRNFAANVAYFSGLAMFIACLGLIGLVAYAVEQKKSEIAVRKVLGSGEFSIVSLLAVDFLKWVVLANFIAWPLAYFGINVWLEGFIYRVSISPLPFIYSGFGALIIALLTITYQSIKAARTNPATALRSE